MVTRAALILLCFGLAARSADQAEKPGPWRPQDRIQSARSQGTGSQGVPYGHHPHYLR